MGDAASGIRLGPTVEEVSIPMHLRGAAICKPIAFEGLTDIMVHGNGFGAGRRVLYVASLLDYHSNWRSRADELSKSLKISMFVGEHMLKYHRGHYSAKAQNVSRQLKLAYDSAVGQYDLLLMPTMPIKSQPIPPPDASLALYIQRAFEMIANTAPFDTTAHPTMTAPRDLSDGLPIGLMLIGKHYEQSTIHRAAAAFERLGDWRTM